MAGYTEHLEVLFHKYAGPVAQALGQLGWVGESSCLVRLPFVVRQPALLSLWMMASVHSTYQPVPSPP